MRSVGQARRALDRALDDAVGLGDPEPLERILAAGLPPWASLRQRERLLEDARLAHLVLAEGGLAEGEVWAVVVHPEGQAQLVRLQVAWAVPTDPAAPAVAPGSGTERLSSTAEDALSRGALAALADHPRPVALDPRRDLRFALSDLEGRPEGVRVRIHGSSLGLAAAVATWSLLVGTAPRADLVFTGAIGLDQPGGRVPVSEVGRLLEKAREVEAADFRLVGPAPPEDTRPAALEPVAFVDEALDLAFGRERRQPQRCPEPPGFDAGLALERLDLAYRRQAAGGSWQLLRERFLDLAGRARLPPASRALARARAAACLSHQGHTEAVLHELDAALRLLSRLPEDELPGDVEVRTRTHRGVCLRDLWRFEEACEELERAEALARELRLPRERVNARSSHAQALVGAGRPGDAVAFAREARDFYDARHSYECARNHTYLVDALARSGDLAAATEEHALGCAHNLARAERAQVADNRAFLDYALLAGRWDWLRLWEQPRTRPGTGPDRAEDLHADLVAALERGSTRWPGPGLVVVERAVRLQVLGPAEAPVVKREVEEDLARTFALASRTRRELRLLVWVQARGFLELAVALAMEAPTEALALARRAWGLAPPEARRWHGGAWARIESAGATGDGDALRRGIHALLRARNH